MRRMMEIRKSLGLVVVIACWSLMIQTSPAASEDVSVAVKANIKTLIQTNSCPGCDLTGANLNRLNLTGANLTGANLTGAKIFLADLTEANLKNANLQRAGFGGTDLAGADLSGADLRGADLSGAYVEGAKFDGKFVLISPYEQEGISEIKKEVYAADTVKPKEPPTQKEVTIGRRRDFQETPPAITKESGSTVHADVVQDQHSGTINSEETTQPGPSDSNWQVKEQKSAAVKQIQPIQGITFQNKKKTGSESEQTINEKDDYPLVAAVTPMEDVSKKDVPKPPAAAIIAEDIEAGDQKKSKGFWSTIKTSLGIESKSADAIEEKQEITQVEEKQVVEPEMTTSESPENVDSQTPKEDELKPEVQTTRVAETETADQEESEGLWDKIKNSLGMESKSAEEIQEKQEVARVEEKQVAESVTTTAETLEKNKIKEENIQPEPVVETAETSTGPVEVQKEKITAVSQSDNEKPQLPEPENEQLIKLQEKKRCYHCDLTNLNLSGMDLEDADLEGSDLSGSNLEEVDLEGANLRATKFIHANLKNANLRESDLYKSDLTGADLTGADLKDALMDDANISAVIGMRVESVLIEKK